MAVSDLYDPGLGDSTISPPGGAESILSSLPSAWVTTGWNMGRVSNTITGGGTSGRMRRRVGEGFYKESRGHGGMLRGGVVQTGGFRHWNKLTRAANIDPTFHGEKSKIYSPFGQLSGAGNFAVKNTIGRMKNEAGELPKVMRDLVGDTPMGKNEKYFAQGSLGRIQSMGKINNMGAERLAKRSTNIAAAVQDLHPSYYAGEFTSGMQKITAAGADHQAMKFGMSSGIGTTMNSGRISGRISGYIQGAQAAKAGETAMMGARATASGAFAEGLEGGIAAFTKEGGATWAAKLAGSGAIASSLRGVNVAGNIMLAHDAALLMAKGVGALVKTGIEAGRSAIGSIDKPVMGMGFKDNQVAATSRARGVMAISNSRLNARSALGSEAAQMNAYFG